MSDATSAIDYPLYEGVSTTIMLAKETMHEFVKLLRRRQFAIATKLMPVTLYAVFGASNHATGQHGVQMARYMLAGYASFGVIAASLYGIGLNLAMERAQNWIDLKRSSPLPFSAYLLAKAITATAFGALTVLLLQLVAVTYGHVYLTGQEAIEMIGVSLAGSVVFGTMGILIALVVPSNATHSVFNFIHLPMAFLSGLWVPLGSLPHWVQVTAPYLPAYHLAQIMLGILGYAQPGSMGFHWLYLGVFGGVLLFLSRIALRVTNK
jgi:ABC-2 type transport system permease protein